MKILIAAALLIACSAQAQTVWRCGPEGRSYSASPCTGGRLVLVADARDAADVEAAREVAERERALATRMVREREQAQEAQTPRANARRNTKAKTVKPAKPPKVRRPAPGDDDIWRAVAPSSRSGKG
jgi:hypothetical protein